MNSTIIKSLFCVLVSRAAAVGAEPATRPGRVDPLADLAQGTFHWQVGKPLIAPANRPEDPCHAIKDPSIVRYDGRWHVFCTIRSQKRTHQIEYVSFADFEHTSSMRREVLKCHDGFFCAPQVFFFSPQMRWYLVYQTVLDKDKGMVPACSTTTHIADPASWSRPVALIDRKPEDINWIDFWVICDETHAYLFFTSLDGRMWRCRTPTSEFPSGWSRPQLALRGDIFEASHTYRYKGLPLYVTLVEAQNGGRRYYKAYEANALDGEWVPLAATREKPFASPVNVRHTHQRWTDSFSHGELIRSGHDEKLEVDPARLRFLFQGITDEQMAGKPYGLIPWRLGLLEQVTE